MRNSGPAIPATPFWRVARKHLADPRSEREFGEYQVEFVPEPAAYRVRWSQGILEITSRGIGYQPARRDADGFAFEWSEVKATKAPERGSAAPLRITTTRQTLELMAEKKEAGLICSVHALLQWVLHVRASGSELGEFGIESSA